MTDAAVVTRLLTSHHHTARFIGRGTPYWLEGGSLIILVPKGNVVTDRNPRLRSPFMKRTMEHRGLRSPFDWPCARDHATRF